uniref:Dipeptidyl-peptidase 7 n=1 Tax=Cyprinus carpio carpio TaxID=630221 RepID=A0A8C1DDS7_CYPCA
MMAMLDYPYSTHFMGSMPAFPVKVLDMSLSSALILCRPTGIVYNSTGQLPCYDLCGLYVECADPTGCGLGFDSYAWDYQACTEIEMCYESNNVTGMFPPMTFSKQQREQFCSKRWGVTSMLQPFELSFLDLTTASNIFSIGDLVPWANGGVRRCEFSNPADPESVIMAWKEESEISAQWVKAARKKSL